ncbi:MAG TPA: ROK family protein, partial [Burkholderiaceae bacterium]|nr:ROK family protein [Burkholderiaceae bacterium]
MPARPTLPAALPTIGVDLGGTKIEAIVLDAHGASLWRERTPTPAGDYRATLAAVTALVARAERELGLAGCRVGVGTPGSATSAGLIKNANSTCLNGQPLQRDLSDALQRPVRLANDANCLALSEATDGAAAGAGVAFAVILGTGVGAGIVVHGRPLHGPNGLAGEWGHNPLPWADASERDGPACYCGQHGCIETWLSGPALARDHARHGRATIGAIDAREIGTRAAHGDTACLATLQRHASRLARSLAHVINLLDPDAIVLAGGVSRLPGLVDAVTGQWAAHVFGAGPDEPVRTR